jgi:hypothetical protein
MLNGECKFMVNNNDSITCEYLLGNFNEKACYKSSKLNLKHPFEKDVYNITAPFIIKGKTFIAGRLEQRDSEFSEIAFFEKDMDVWNYIELPSKLELQDPFVTFIDNKLLLGGVKVEMDLQTNKLVYKTVLYQGDTIFDLKYIFEGPMYMKDIRFSQLKDGKILVLTRPQGEIGGRGTIGYFIINSLNDFSIEKVNNATLLSNQFVAEEWGGSNEIHLMEGNKVGVLAHIAKFDDDGNRHYYSSAFILDYITGEYSPMKIIAIKKLFDCENYKRVDLKDVVFSGGLIRNEDNTADLYCGVSDCEAHTIKISDPFHDIAVNF